MSHTFEITTFFAFFWVLYYGILFCYFGPRIFFLINFSVTLAGVTWDSGEWGSTPEQPQLNTLRFLTQDR